MKTAISAFQPSPNLGVAPVVSSYTYNANGQVLTVDRRRSATSQPPTYYTGSAFTGTDPNAIGHTIGDLQSVKDSFRQPHAIHAVRQVGPPV